MMDDDYVRPEDYNVLEKTDYNSLWNDDEPELLRRIEELEARMEEMWERMKQYEEVMSTAFRIRDAGDWRIKNK